MRKINIIEPQKSFKRINFKEIYSFRDLLYFMVLRDITVVYKQSIFGYAWALVNPIFSMLVFSIVFGKLARVPSDGIPYPIFTYSALIPWTYFANSLNASGSSLITSSSLFTKVYFPRLIIPLTPILSKLVDFAISFVVLVLLMFYYQYHPTIKILLIPLLIIVLISTTCGIGFWLSSLAIQYRDVKFGITFAVPLLMYAAPVVFPASLILENYGELAYKLYGLYPMTGVIEGFRAAVISSKSIPWDLIGISSVSAFLYLFLGLSVFNKLESKFADVA